MTTRIIRYEVATAAEIKQAVEDGFNVYTGTPNYQVVKDDRGQFFIVSKFNNYTIGLTWTDETTLNNYGDFFITEGDWK